MNSSRTLKEAFVAVISILLVLMLCGAATFAWFTSNTKVSTSTATGRSGSGNLQLLIGSDEGSLYDSSETEVEIEQVNEGNAENLMPVSTADLETFVYATMYSEGKAVGFSKDEDEKKIWHGKIYLEMRGDNVPEGTVYNLYLDSADSEGGAIGQASDGNLLNGARLGFKFEDEEPVIVRFDEDNKGTTENNTVIDGKVLENGYVLDSGFNAVSDPSVEFSSVCIDSSEENITFPDEPLAKLTVNQPAGIDVYFYIEGCDEDSVKELAKNEAEMHLAFYAVAE